MGDEFDWAGVEAVATDHIVSAVRRVRKEHPSERVYGAIVNEFYGDGAQVAWPVVTVGTEESLARLLEEFSPVEQARLTPILRWSGPDLAHQVFANDVQDEWAARCQDFAATSGIEEQWHAVYEEFLLCFPRAARQATAVLLEAGDVDRTFIAVAMDEEGFLVPLSVTPEVLRQHFPEFEAD